MLHRIAFPVVSEWYQQKHGCFTIMLARGTHPKYVWYRARNASIQPTLDRYVDNGITHQVVGVGGPDYDLSLLQEVIRWRDACWERNTEVVAG